MAATAEFTAVPILKVTNFTIGDSTNKIAVYTAAAKVRLDKFFITSNDPTGRAVTIYLSDGTTEGIVDEITLRPSTGARRVAHWNMLDPNRITALHYTDPEFTLPAGAVLSVAMGSAVTAAKTVSVFLLGGTF